MTDLQVYKQNIIQSRSNGFGGSDAKMIAKIAENGTEIMSDTDKRRIACVCGLAEYVGNRTTPEMDSGNMFEAFLAEAKFVRKAGYTNNAYMTNPEINQTIKNFDVFAHADFLNIRTGKKVVLEAKFTKADLDETIETYMWQLQWYYMLGADSVYIVKGTQGMPFALYEKRLISRDDRKIETLLKGIRIIDEYIDSIVYVEKTEWTLSDLMPTERSQVENMYKLLADIKIMEERVEKLKASILEAMTRGNAKKISSELYTITYVGESVKRSLDKVKLFREHPEISEQDYMKQTITKPYVKMVLKDDKSVKES